MCWKPPRHHLPPPSDFTVRVSSLHHGAAIIEKMPRHVTGSKTSEKTRKKQVVPRNSHESTPGLLWGYQPKASHTCIKYSTDI